MSILAARGNRVLYVDPIISPAAKMRASHFFSRVSLRSNLRDVTQTLHVLTPPFGIPLGRYPSVCRMNQAILFRSVRHWQEKLGLVNPILWVYEPRAFGFIVRLQPKLLVYGCVDEHKAYPGVNKNHIEQLEHRLLEASDVVFVTAQGLLESRRQHNPNVFFIPNGVDTEMFRKALAEKSPVAAEIGMLPRPVLGFVGGIHSWTDFDLLSRVATAHADGSLVLVGPIGRDVSAVQMERLRGVRNVHFLGFKKAETIPYYVKSFDVCLNIFRATELTRTVNPIKIYEYLAVGRPIVSVDMPEIRRLRELIYIAESPSEFLEKIQIALREDDERKRSRRIERAQEYSWEVLLERAWHYVEAASRSENSIGRVGAAKGRRVFR